MPRLAEALPAGVHSLAIPTPFPVGPVNVIVIEDDPLTLVDTGLGTAAALLALEEQLGSLDLRVADIELVLLTHHHPDHSGLAASIVRRSGAQVAALDLLATLMAGYDEWADAEVDGASELMRQHGVDPGVADALRRVERLAFAFTGGVHVDRALGDGSTVELRDRTLTVHHRPGHSQTDTIFHDEAGSALIGGDHLLAHISSHAVVGLRPDGTRTQPLLDQRRSLQATAALRPEVVLGGHGPAIGDPAGLIERRLRQQDDRAERLLDLLRSGPSTAYALATGLLGPTVAEHPFLAVSEVLGHLDLLLESGAVAEEHDGGPVRFAARR